MTALIIIIITIEIIVKILNVVSSRSSKNYWILLIILRLINPYYQEILQMAIFLKSIRNALKSSKNNKKKNY